MTKKDYELFARWINRLPTWEDSQGRRVTTFDNVVEMASRAFLSDSARFQPAKFREACLTGKHIRKALSLAD